MRGLLLKISLTLVSVAFAVGFAEVALRLAHYGEAARTPLQKLMAFDPLLGWRHQRNASFEVTTSEYHTTVQYNAHGVRGPDRPYSKPPDVPRIVVLGDSFVDAYTVQIQDQFTEVLEASLGPRFEVINLGVTGYSTDQELLLLEEEGWKYQPDLVVLAFYYNDVWGNGSPDLGGTATSKPVFFRDAGGSLSLTNVPVPRPAPTLRHRFKVFDLIRTAVRGNPWLHGRAIKAGLAQGEAPPAAPPAPSGAAGGGEEFRVYQRTETPELKREWSITQALLRRMKQETGERGARFVIFYVPTRIELSPEEWKNEHLPSVYDPGEVSRRLDAICKAEAIPYIEPSEDFREAAKQGPLYYPHDPHWNAAGHHLAGKLLAEYVRTLWQGTRQ
jgi:acetyltransferase AlgX (SGNH hydrolase-like protein)